MSALTKPLIHPTTAASGGVVNIELVEGVETRDMPAVTDGPVARYFIDFSFGKDLPLTSWEYAASGARNTAFAAIKTLASTAI